MHKSAYGSMSSEPAETRARSNFPESRVAFPRYNQLKLNTDETIFIAGTEYFGQNAVQPRNHIPVNTIRKSHNHFRGTDKTIHNHA